MKLIQGIISKIKAKKNLVSSLGTTGRKAFRRANKQVPDRNMFSPIEKMTLDLKTLKKIAIPKGMILHFGEDPNGIWQKDFLIRQGLQSTDILLDIGCGDLREGVPLIRYLQPTHYHGLDQAEIIIKQGFLSMNSSDWEKKPNFFLGGDFDLLKTATQYDYIWAHSVFSHIDLSLIGKCLASAFQVLKPGGKFLASYFEASGSNPWCEPTLYTPAYPKKNRKAKYTYSFRNPFHHKKNVLSYIGEDVGFKVTFLSDVSPKKQQIVCFTKPN